MRSSYNTLLQQIPIISTSVEEGIKACADSLPAAQETISGRLKTKLCSLIVIQEEDLDPTKPIVTYGIDSLVGTELRNWITKEAGARIQLLELMSSISWGALVELIASRSTMVDHKRYVQANGSG